MQSVLSLILGGGRGTRLFPLTQLRSKPAVPIAGKYRLIDIPISNCINSGVNRIYVLTQFLSVSLHRHIANTYKFDPFSQGFVEVLAAQQTLEAADWYQGTADAVRRNRRYIQEDTCREVLILSGDQLYRMDYQQLLRTHREGRADVSIAVLPVPKELVSDVGTIKSYHEATLALAGDDPPFDLHSPQGVIYTHMRNLPAARVSAAHLEQCLVSDGCVIGPGTRVERSVVGVRSRIGRNVTLR